MVHNFFQRFVFRCLFYTSIAGFISGSALGFLHVKGWVVDAEKGLILYGVAFGIGAFLATSFVLFQLRRSQLKVAKVKRLVHPIKILEKGSNK